MLGLATATEFRLAAYGVVLAAICGVLLYTHHSGYEACRAPQKAAEKSQVEKDLADAKGTIDELRTKLEAMPPSQPAPVLRLCQSPGRVRAQPPSKGTEPIVAPAARESAGGVPQGAPGLDIGQPVSDVERAAEVIAIYRDTTWDWAVKQAKETH